MFPKIPKSLLNTLEAQQRLFNNPHIQKLQQLTNNFQQFNELRARLESYNLNGIIQQAKLYSLQTQVKFYNPDIQAINLQLQNINLYAKNFEYLNTLINSAVDSYNSTQEEEFKVSIENIPVSIPKTKIDEYIQIFQGIGIPHFMSIRLSLAIVILFLLFPYTFFAPNLEPILCDLAKWILEVLSFYYQISIDLLKPENFAKLTLFPLVKKIWDILNDHFNDTENKKR